ncbi:MAG: twin-arginine translocase TatA/TatE family subunit [Chthoniobacteraceae bacterium]|nr:twin-arginine translocase TatA/TatE family subunit [Chthoniobacteraceae bacterium]
MVFLGFFNNLGGMDGIILLFLVLLLFGAKRLPELARSLGSAINEFNKAKEDVHRQITQAVEPPPAAPVNPVVPPQSEPSAQPPLPPQQQPPAA